MLIIKVGGGSAINQAGIVQDIKNLRQKVIFVHGGRVQADQIAKKLGYPTQRITSPSGMESILTDKQAMKVMTMVYSGLVNKQWVELFQQHALNAIGLSGADGRIWEGKRKEHLIAQDGDKEKLIKGTWTGKVKKINTTLIQLLLDSDYLPVITQPAVSRTGNLINTDNDRNLAVTAKSLGVKELVVLFEAPGLLRKTSDDTSLIRKLNKEDLPEMTKYAKGTMKKKILGAQEAFTSGVKTIYWGDARVKHPVKSALAGKGTTIQ